MTASKPGSSYQSGRLDLNDRRIVSDYVVERLNLYEELTILSYSPSFLIERNANIMEKRDYRLKMIERIKNIRDKPEENGSKVTNIYVASSGMYNVLRISDRVERTKTLEWWDEVSQICHDHEEKLKIYVLEDSLLPTVSFILGKVPGPWAYRAPYDLLVEYRIGVGHDDLFSSDEENGKKYDWFLKVPMVELPMEIKWLQDNVVKHYQDRMLEAWIKKERIHQKSPYPTNAIINAMPNESIGLKSIFEKSPGSEPGNMTYEFNRYDISEYFHLPNPGYGRYAIHQQVAETCTKAENDNIDTFYLLGVAGGSKSNDVNLFDVVISESIWELVYGKFVHGGVDNKALKHGRKKLELDNGITMITGAEEIHLMDEDHRLREAVKHLINLSVSDRENWIKRVEKHIERASKNKETFKLTKEEVTEVLRDKPLKIHFKPIWSSDHNINDLTLSSKISDIYKVYAFDMEGGGFAEACKAFGKRFMEVRGISDLADGERGHDAVYQPIAIAVATAALEFLLEVIMTWQMR